MKLLQSFVLSCVERQRSRHTLHLEHYDSTHTAHQHTCMFPLQWMWGNIAGATLSLWSALATHYVASAVASCGCNVAKRLQKHFTKHAKLPKLTNHQLCPAFGRSWQNVTMMDLQRQQHRAGLMNSRTKNNHSLTCTEHVHERNPKIWFSETKSLSVVHSPDKPGEELVCPCTTM